jgi:hypothetical protein
MTRGMPKNLFDGTRGALRVALLALVGACAKQEKTAAAEVAATRESAVTDIWTVRIPAGRGLREASAAAMSVTQPGVVFTITDSGNEPRLFAVDTTGALRGVWQIAGGTNLDWEAVAVGPCATAGRSCVYIGDVGDNDAEFPSRAIYRVEEPRANGTSGSLAPHVLQFSYPDERHDVESMYVAPNGDIFLITKRPLSAGADVLRPALVYAIPSSAWAAKSRVVAQLVDSLPIVPGSALLRLVTDAGLSPDGRHLAVRTYTEAYIFATNATTGRVDHAVAPFVCDLVPLGEGQGEGITWGDARGRLVFTSEGKVPQLQLGSCRLPR